jgi:hypothetical protein
MQITQSSTPVIIFLLVDSDDSRTAATGLTPAVTLSKAGGAFAAATNAVTEISGGFYKVTLTAGETGTIGPLTVIATATGADVWRDIHQVV